MSPVVNIYACQRTENEDQREVTISITRPLPTAETLKEQAQIFEKESEDLFFALVQTLPGGTLDRLIARFMRHACSNLRIRHDQIGNKE